MVSVLWRCAGWTSMGNSTNRNIWLDRCCCWCDLVLRRLDKRVLGRKKNRLVCIQGQTTNTLLPHTHSLHCSWHRPKSQFPCAYRGRSSLQRAVRKCEALDHARNRLRTTHMNSFFTRVARLKWWHLLVIYVYLAMIFFMFSTLRAYLAPYVFVPLVVGSFFLGVVVIVLNGVLRLKVNVRSSKEED